MRTCFTSTLAVATLALIALPRPDVLAQTTNPPLGIAALMEGLPPNLAKRAQNKREVLANVGIDGSIRGAASGIRVWRTAGDRKITVCIDGSIAPDVRRFVMESALEWQKDSRTSVPFDFGRNAATQGPQACLATGKPANIRVFFHSTGEFGGRWSLIGNDSMIMPGVPPVVVSQYEPSMNLQTLAETFKSDKREARRIVMHEFGHALGLEHEHQRPYNDCQRHLDRPKTLQIMTGPPQLWTSDQVWANFKLLADKGVLADDGEAPDTASIMYYKLERALFKTSAPKDCAIETANAEISTRDRAFIAEIYPKDTKKQEAFLKAREARVKAMMDGKEKRDGTQFNAAQKKRSADLVKALFED